MKILDLDSPGSAHQPQGGDTRESQSMTTDEIISRCYEHGQPDYVLAANRLKDQQAVALKAYALLWRDMGEPSCFAKEARKLLRDLLTYEETRAAITWVKEVHPIDDDETEAVMRAKDFHQPQGGDAREAVIEECARRIELECDEDSPAYFAAIIRALATPPAPVRADLGASQPPEWFWYGEVDGVDIVTFGRWPKGGAKWRYKWADIQPTEHDHLKTSRQTFEEILASLNYDGQDTNSLTVGEIRRAL